MNDSRNPRFAAFVLSVLFVTTGSGRTASASVPPTSVGGAASNPTSGDIALGFSAANGNDGNLATFNPTNPAPNNPPWEVNLQGTFSLTEIVATNRVDCCNPNRLKGSTISLIPGGSARATGAFSDASKAVCARKRIFTTLN